MAVKYVKDFSFPASGGFHGDVQRFAKGGHVTKMPAKAKASAKDVPARAKPNAPARGAPKMKSEPAKGKRQGYNEGGRVPGYDMDRLPAKKPPGRTMDLARSKPFKGAYEGYADGGEVAMPSPTGPQIVEEYDALPAPEFMRPSESLTYRWSDGTYNYLPEETGKRTPLGALSSGLRAKDPRSQEPVYARDVETRLDRGVRPGQMARQQRVEDRVNAARQAMFEDKAPSYLLPPEEPRYLVPEMPDYGRESIMPVPGPGGGGLSGLIGSLSARERMPAPYMPTYTSATPEESDAYLKAAGIVPRAEARFAKGGKVQKVMREYKEGKLHSGSKKGPMVKDRKQAVAIALSEARKAGAKIPKKAEGGIFSTESMAYQSKGPKTRGTYRKGREQGRRERMERLAQEKMEHAEKYAPGLSLDMPDRKKHGGMPVHRRKPMYGGGKC